MSWRDWHWVLLGIIVWVGVTWAFASGLDTSARNRVERLRTHAHAARCQQVAATQCADLLRDIRQARSER